MKITTKLRVKKEKKETKEEAESAVQYDIIKTEQGEYKTHLTKKFLNRKSYAPLNLKHVISAIPGTITKLNIETGSEVAEGDVILELEAMKMNNKILAPMSGKIKEIFVQTGIRIPKNFLMVEFE